MVFEKIKVLICDQFGVDKDSVTEDTEFIADLSADSLDVVELIMSIEDTFGLDEIGEEDIKSIVTVGDLAAYVTRKMG